MRPVCYCSIPSDGQLWALGLVAWTTLGMAFFLPRPRPPAADAPSEFDPDFSRLPFPTMRAEWMGYTQQSPEDFVDVLRGKWTGTPVVMLHLPAVARFAEAAAVPIPQAIVELGGGALRWLQTVQLGDGHCYSVQFRGAPQVNYTVGRLGRFLMVHLPPEG